MNMIAVCCGALVAIGTSRHFAAPQNLSPIGLTTDKGWRRASIDTQRLTQLRHWLCTAAMVLMPVCRATSGAVTATCGPCPVSYTHLRAHETRHDLVCRLLLE